MRDATQTPPPTDGDGNSLEDLLVQVLEALEAKGAAAVEELLAANPAHAAAVRTHLERLNHLGFVGAEDVGAEAFPERLGEFHLLERLGGGGMGVVYVAEQTSLGRRIALKLVRSEHLYFPGARERFRREVEAAARLQHPGIVPVYAAGEDAGVPWLAMEHVPGASLDEVLQRLAGRDPALLVAEDLPRAVRAVAAARATPPAPVAWNAGHARSWVDACLRIVEQVALALQHAHERGVLHRDVKPSNVVLALDGRPMLVDFGLALPEGSTRLTGTGGQLGSPAYMSPEQIRGDQRRVDARTDVYSLGVTLYELLTLRAPFASDSTSATRELVVAGRPDPMRARNPAIPRDVETVCKKAMDVDPARRYATAAAFAADLGNLLARRPITAAPPGRVLAARRWAQRHPARAVAIVAGVLLFCVAPTVFLLQENAANERLRVAYEQLQAANQRVRVQRDRALAAVKKSLTLVATEDLLDVPRMQHLRRKLLDEALAFHELFLAENRDDPDVLDLTAGAALEVAILDAELGRVERTHTTFAHAVELARRLVAASPERAANHTRLCEALTALAHTHQTRGEHEAAHASLVEAAAAGRQALVLDPDEIAAGKELMRVARVRGLVCSQQKRTDEAVAAYDEVRTLWAQFAPRLEGTEHWADAVNHLFCAAVDEVPFLLGARGPEAAAAAAARADEVAAAYDHDDLPTPAQLARSRLLLARAKIVAPTDPAAAEKYLRRVFEHDAELLELAPDHANALRTDAMASHALAFLLAKSPERAAEAAPLLEQAIATLRRLVAVDPQFVENRANLASSLNNLGAMKLTADPTAARALFVEAAEIGAAALAAAPARTEWGLIEYNARWFLGQACGALHDHAGEAAAAEQLAALRPDDAKTQRIAGGLMADSLRWLPADTSLTDGERRTRHQGNAKRAMALLREAARLGCADAEWLRSGPDAPVLRELEGYDEVLRAFTANAERSGGGSDRGK